MKAAFSKPEDLAGDPEILTMSGDVAVAVECNGLRHLQDVMTFQNI